MNKVTFLCAIALMSIARSSAAQQCPPAQFGQPCTGGSVGTCVTSSCSSEADDGAAHGEIAQPPGNSDFDDRPLWRSHALDQRQIVQVLVP